MEPELVTPAAAPAPATTSPGILRKVFYGPSELRAGWRLLIFFVLFFTVTYLFNKGLRLTGYKPGKNAESDPIFNIFSRAFAFLLVLFPTFIMSRIEGRRLGEYGLPARGAFNRLFWEGWLWGFGALTLLLAVLRLSGAFYFGHRVLDPLSALRFAFLWGVGMLMVGFFEEYLMRGYVQYTLTMGTNFWIAAVITSLLFAAGHIGNPGESRFGVLDVFLAGMGLCVMLWRTGNLWFAVAFHAGWDWAETYFYGVPDSGVPPRGNLFMPSIPSNRPAWLTGGTVGPEGSIFSCVIEVVIILFVLWRFKGVAYAPALRAEPVSSSPLSSR